MNSIEQPIKISRQQYIFIVLGVLIALLVGTAAALLQSIYLPLFPVVLLGGFILFICIFKSPVLGLWTTVFYCCFIFFFYREIGGPISWGLGVEACLLLTLLSLWYNANKFNFQLLNNNLFILLTIWFLISVAEIINPEGASPRGWLQEIRSSGLYPFIFAGLGLLFIDSKKKVNQFITLIIIFCFIAAVNGIKQKLIGLSDGEIEFLKNGGEVTHMLNGQLRVFSIYSNAGQFGPSQAQLSAICLILATGGKKLWKKLLFIILGLIFFYGMLISGTRGALFAFIGALAFGIFLIRNTKVMLIGGFFLFGFIGFLKFTSIGNQNYGIFRLRTALDTKDASLNVRVMNQQKLAAYMKTKPFGGGLGIIGFFGHKYNEGKYLASIEPDSYWVKVWAMYGIVGFTFWFCMIMYLFGKGTGIVWSIRDDDLRLKLTAFLAGNMGIFLCSYGNEVMNDMPSLMIIYLSFAIVFVAPRLEGVVPQNLKA